MDLGPSSRSTLGLLFSVEGQTCCWDVTDTQSLGQSGPGQSRKDHDSLSCPESKGRDSWPPKDTGVGQKLEKPGAMSLPHSYSFTFQAKRQFPGRPFQTPHIGPLLFSAPLAFSLPPPTICLFTLSTHSCWLASLFPGKYHHPHLTEEKIKSQRRRVTCSKAQREWPRQGEEPWVMDSFFFLFFLN